MCAHVCGQVCTYWCSVWCVCTQMCGSVCAHVCVHGGCAWGCACVDGSRREWQSHASTLRLAAGQTRGEAVQNQNHPPSDFYPDSPHARARASRGSPRTHLRGGGQGHRRGPKRTSPSRPGLSPTLTEDTDARPCSTALVRATGVAMGLHFPSCRRGSPSLRKPVAPGRRGNASGGRWQWECRPRAESS